MKIAAATATALLATSCASLNYRPRVDPLGPVHVMALPDLTADDMNWDDARDVRVLLGELPPGLSWGPGGIVVQDPRYRVVGHVGAFPKPGHLSYAGLWFYDYPEDEAFRNVYCNAQIPLSWLTFTLWTWLTPFYYPCRIVETNRIDDVAERRMRILATLRKATKAAGGNLLVVTHLGNHHFVRFTRWGEFVGEKEMMNGQGIAIRDTGRQ